MPGVLEKYFRVAIEVIPWKVPSNGWGLDVNFFVLFEAFNYMTQLNRFDMHIVVSSTSSKMIQSVEAFFLDLRSVIGNNLVIVNWMKLAVIRRENRPSNIFLSFCGQCFNILMSFH